MNEATQAAGGSNKRWWAKAIFMGGIFAVVCVALGAIGAKAGLWGFQFGFTLLGVGTVIATITFFLGIVAYVVCVTRKLTAERTGILIGVGLGAVILIMMGMQFSAATSVPPIHHISTDTERPPQFDKVVAIRDAQGSNPLEYNAAAWAELQRGAYPYVKPLISSESPSIMLERAVDVLESMGLEIVDTNPGAGIVEATATTFWFGFKDDVVVRVRAEGSGSIVDVRSVSRVGGSDLGTNARRIGEILAALGAK